MFEKSSELEIAEYDTLLKSAGIKHFGVDEICKLRKAKGQPIVVPPKGIRTNILDALTLADKVRDEMDFPLSIPNGYRPKAYNKMVKGARRSTHINNWAVDVQLTRKNRDWDTQKFFYEFAVALHMTEEAKDLKMGLGLYARNGGIRIHIDTGVKYRYWGGTWGSWYREIRKRVR